MRVLIADDGPVERLLARRTVESLGHECLVAKDGEEAWQLFREVGADVILSDWLMPRLDGVELCRLVRAHVAAPYTYIVLLTVLGDRGHAVAGMHAGADEYLAKPLKIDQLEKCLIAAERVTTLHRRLLDQQVGRERALARRDQILGLARQLASSSDPGQLLRELLAQAVDMLDASSGSIGRWDEAQQAVVPIHAVHRRAASAGDVQAAQQFASEAVARRQVVLSRHEAVAAPLLYDDRLLGGLCVAGPPRGQPFGGEDADALEQLARTGAAALVGLERARREATLLARRTLMADLNEDSADQAPLAPSARHNLPPQATPLVGRERELEALRGLLLRPDVHLVTLTGPAGVGKTRLALAVSAGLLEAFPDGVCYVDLTSIDDPALVVPTLARVLGVDGLHGPSMIETLQRTLAHKRLLLVMDSFEHVLPAGRPLADLVRGCAEVTVLVSSRSALKLHAEHVFPVSPLDLPDPGVDDVSLVARSPAVALYVQRVRAVQPGFELTSDNARGLADACIRLDGLPLAIELAAARSRVLPPQALSARLESPLAILAGGPLDLPERHRSLRGALAWSYGLLEPAEQWLFRQASVFSRGFSLEAATAMFGQGADDDSNAMLDELSGLVDKSLLGRQSQADAEPRFVMLEIIREYAAEQLRAEGQLEEARRRHAAYFTRLAELAEGELAGPGQAAWLDRLEWDLDNFRAALQWSIESDHAAVELRLGAALARFWYLRGYRAEGKAALAAALARGADAPTQVRARACLGAALLALGCDDWRAAEAYLEQAQTLWRDLDSSLGRASALAQLASVHLRRVRTAPAEDPTRRSSPAMLAAARTAARDAVAMARELGDARLLASARQRAAEVATAYARYDDARDLYRQSFTTARDLGDRWQAAAVLEGLGSLAAATGQPRQALVFSGLASRLRHMLRTPLEELEQRQLERGLAAARAELGVEVAAEAWAEGYATPLEALDLDAPPASTSQHDSADVKQVAALLRATGLTRREAEVAPLVACGLSNRDISQQLGTSEKTTETHVSHILRKLELNSRTQLAAWLLARQ